MDQSDLIPPPPLLSDDAVRATMRHMSSKRHPRHCDVVGPKAIAERTGVQVNTVHMWRKRNVMPAARWTESDVPLWCWTEDIVPWLQGDPRRAHLVSDED